MLLLPYHRYLVQSAAFECIQVCARSYEVLNESYDRYDLQILLTHIESFAPSPATSGCRTSPLEMARKSQQITAGQATKGLDHYFSICKIC